MDMLTQLTLMCTTFFFFARTAEKITHFITGIDRAGGFSEIPRE